jgi:TRAP-type transport system small permease protein
MKEYNFLSIIDNCLQKINRLIEYIIGLAVLIIALVFLWEIFIRFFGIGSLRWALEINRMLFITIGFMGSTVAYYRKSHIHFEFLSNKVEEGSKLNYMFNIFIEICIIMFAIILLRTGSMLCITQITTRLPATGLSRIWLFITLPISGFLLLLYSFMDLYKDYLKLKNYLV